MKEILDVVHKTIYQFFDVCGDEEEIPVSDKDKLLLEVNKAICDNLKTLEQESILDKIREEVESIEHYGTNNGNDFWLRTPDEIKKDVLAILDKYKAESE